MANNLINMQEEYIDIHQCSTFEQMMLHIMASIEDEHEFKSILEFEYLNIGGVEVYPKFRINFSEIEWVKLLGDLPEDHILETIEDQFQDVALAAAKLATSLKQLKDIQKLIQP